MWLPVHSSAMALTGARNPRVFPAPSVHISTHCFQHISASYRSVRLKVSCPVVRIGKGSLYQRPLFNLILIYVPHRWKQSRKSGEVSGFNLRRETPDCPNSFNSRSVLKFVLSIILETLKFESETSLITFQVIIAKHTKPRPRGKAAVRASLQWSLRWITSLWCFIHIPIFTLNEWCHVRLKMFQFTTFTS